MHPSQRIVARDVRADPVDSTVLFDRLDGLFDEPRPGTPLKIGDDEIADTIRLTLDATAPGATHWSPRSMAKAVSYAPSTIHRIWRVLVVSRSVV